MLYKSPTHGKVFGNICIINLVLHALLPDLLLQIVNNCNVNIPVCVFTNLKVLHPGTIGDHFQWKKVMSMILISFLNYIRKVKSDLLSKCIAFSF